MTKEKIGFKPINTYEAACVLHESMIDALALEIFKNLSEQGLNPWVKLEALDRARKLVDESLITVVDPGSVDVVEEDKRLHALYHEVYKNKCIAEKVLALIDSPGYKLRECGINELWAMAAATDPYY